MGRGSGCSGEGLLQSAHQGAPAATQCQGGKDQLGQQVAVPFQGPGEKSRCPEKGKENRILSRTWLPSPAKVWWRGYLLQEAPLALGQVFLAQETYDTLA